jgi:hypothetical protein
MVLREFITSNLNLLPHNYFPTSLFLQVLTVVMEWNVFSFMNSLWLQVSGTAMGTPAASPYAMSYGQNKYTKS